MTKLTKEERQQRKEYFKMLKHYKKTIRALAKDASTKPFDWQFGMDLFIEYMKFMKEYYEIGYNVWACEITKKCTRAKSLAMTLDEYNTWMDNDSAIFDKYYKKTEDAKALSAEEAAKAYSSEINLHKKKFFNYLFKYLQDWWD